MTLSWGLRMPTRILVATGLVSVLFVAVTSAQDQARIAPNDRAIRAESARVNVVVTGEVGASGTYSLAGGMHVLEALMKAGSITENAGDEAIIVRARTTPANEYVDLRALLGGDAKQNIVLRDGDTVIVPKAQTLYIMGYVRNPGPYRVHRGTTVEQAVALAGGVSEMGNRDDIRVKRIAPGRTKADEMKAGPADLVRPGDIIDVKRTIR